MKLYLVELRRFWSRRITWGTMLVVGLIILGSIGIAFTQTSADVPEDDGPTVNQDCVADLTVFRDNGDQEFEGLTDEEIAETYCTFFEDNDRRFFATEILGGFRSDDWSEYREQQQRTSTELVGGERYRSVRFGLEGIVPGVAIFFLVMAVALGGSFVGAEYRSGTVENLLLWEPRRVKVIATKYLAGFVSSAVVMAIVLFWLTLLLLALAQFRGTFDGIEGRFWVDWVGVVFRASLVSGLFFVLAMAIATLAKNTTAAVVALLGWFVVSNIIIEVFARPFRQYELFTNAGSFIGLGDVGRYVGGDQNRVLVYSHGYLVAGVAVLIWAAIPAAIALMVFRRRDIS